MQGSLFPSDTKADGDASYEAFVNKFKPKKTTDDCYTPPAIYETVKAWVDKNILPLEGVTILRPFKPGGDYERENYPEGCVVLDNPPFSIITKIRRFYDARGIRYFLFAPSLTMASSVVSDRETFIVASADIIYENGADVKTGFVTNLCPGSRLWVAGDLHDEIEAATLRAKADKSKIVYDYPDEVVTCARLQ